MHAADLLTNRARLTPDRAAMLTLPDGRRYTYSQLNERANRLANWLKSLGVGKGDRVSILAYNGIEYIDLFYGLAKIGATLAPLNWRLTARELAYIINDCQPKVLLCGPEFVGVLDDLIGEIPIPSYLRVQGAAFDGALDYDAGLAAASDAERTPDRVRKAPLERALRAGLDGDARVPLRPVRDTGPLGPDVESRRHEVRSQHVQDHPAREGCPRHHRYEKAG